MIDPLTSEDLQAFMDLHQIPGQILILDAPTPTVEAAAQAVGVSPRQIVKSVLFTVPGAAVLTVSCGDQLVERRVIAVSRFGDRQLEESLQRDGVGTIRGDLLDERFVEALPDVPNVIFMTGSKFGTSGNASLTWACIWFSPTIMLSTEETARNKWATESRYESITQWHSMSVPKRWRNNLLAFSLPVATL